jgi:prephenate dehydrogenase
MAEPGFASLANCRITIVGLGLMGGSLALALKGRCREIVGVEADPTTLALARARAVTDRSLASLPAIDCDLLILAIPVRAILSHLHRLAGQTSDQPGRSTLVLDLGSTKQEIVAAMERLPPQFDPLGGHPMCGKEVSGLAHAEPTLYRGKTFVLTPLPRTSPAALALAHDLVETLGATPLVMSAERHDALAAVSSHLPYVAAATLMRAALSLEDAQVWLLAASGFRDTSRLAESDLTMMIDILLTNRAAILDALYRYRNQLEAMISLIDAGDADALRAALVAAQAKRASLFRNT